MLSYDWDTFETIRIRSRQGLENINKTTGKGGNWCYLNTIFQLLAPEIEVLAKRYPNSNKDIDQHTFLSCGLSFILTGRMAIDQLKSVKQELDATNLQESVIYLLTQLIETFPLRVKQYFAATYNNEFYIENEHKEKNHSIFSFQWNGQCHFQNNLQTITETKLNNSFSRRQQARFSLTRFPDVLVVDVQPPTIQHVVENYGVLFEIGKVTESFPIEWKKTTTLTDANETNASYRLMSFCVRKGDFAMAGHYVSIVRQARTDLFTVFDDHEVSPGHSIHYILETFKTRVSVMIFRRDRIEDDQLYQCPIRADLPPLWSTVGFSLQLLAILVPDSIHLVNLAYFNLDVVLCLLDVKQGLLYRVSKDEDRPRDPSFPHIMRPFFHAICSSLGIALRPWIVFHCRPRLDWP